MCIVFGSSVGLCAVLCRACVWLLFPYAWFIYSNLDTVLTTVKLRKHFYWVLRFVFKLIFVRCIEHWVWAQSGVLRRPYYLSASEYAREPSTLVITISQYVQKKKKESSNVEHVLRGMQNGLKWHHTVLWSLRTTLRQYINCKGSISKNRNMKMQNSMQKFTLYGPYGT